MKLSGLVKLSDRPRNTAVDNDVHLSAGSSLDLWKNVAICSSTRGSPTLDFSLGLGSYILLLILSNSRSVDGCYEVKWKTISAGIAALTATGNAGSPSSIGNLHS